MATAEAAGRAQRRLAWQGAAAALPAALPTLLPLAVVLVTALAPQPGVWAHLGRHVLPPVLANTAVLMLLVGIGVLMLGVPLAWLTVRCRFPGWRLFAWALVLPMAFPAYVLAFVMMGLFEFGGAGHRALQQLFGPLLTVPDMRGRLWGLVLVLVLALYPYVYLLARQAFMTQGRRATEVAQSLGHGPWRAFFSVALPMARPWIVAGLSLALMETLADFGAVAVFNYDTFTTAVYKAWFDLHNFGAAAQLASLLALMVLVLVAAEQRARQDQRYAAPDARDLHGPLRGLRAWAATLACALVLAVGFVVPLGQLVLWSWQVWRQDLDARWWGFAWNTLQLGVGTAVLATLLALWLALVRRAHPDPATAWTVRLAITGYAFPGVVLAVGLFMPVAALDNLLLPWLRTLGFEGLQLAKGSLAALLLALSARFLAVAYQATDSALQRIGPQHEEVCASLGLGRWQTLRRLHLPLMRGGLLTAVVLVMVDVMKEMPITLMMRGFGWDTLAVRVFQLTSESMWNHAALPALAIVLIGLAPVALLVRATERASRNHA